MSTYNPLEQLIAQALDSHPTLKSRIKRYYQQANYYLFRERGFEAAVHPGMSLRTIEEEFDSPPLDGEVFFGYFDKDPWSPSEEYGVVHRVQDEDRADVVVLGAGTQTIVGTTPLWNYQQGSMSQWLPNSPDHLIYNDLVDGDHGSRIVSREGETVRELSAPIQTVHPAGGEALVLNYCRLDRLRPDYGYTPESTRFDPELPYDEDGIWKLDLETNALEKLLTIEELRSHRPRSEMDGADHWVNHLLYSPSGDRFVFMHRWEGSGGRFSRLYVCDENGKITLLMDDHIVSHYCWLDTRSVVVWGRLEGEGTGYYEVDTLEGTITPFGDDTLNEYGDGHPSVSDEQNLLVTDTYPDRSRQQHLLLYDQSAKKTVAIGRFFSPLSYYGEKRCDLHPRVGSSNRTLSIDSAHTGSRHSYVVDFD